MLKFKQGSRGQEKVRKSQDLGSGGQDEKQDQF